jgi:hypothetical protein
MSQAFSSLVSSRCRRAASACGIFAANAISPTDRNLLLRMQQSWLARADCEESLRDPPPNPPTRSIALAVPKLA